MRIYTLIVLTLTVSVCLFAEASLRGTVRDSSGGVIPDAAIFVRWDSSGSTVGLYSNVGIKEDLVVRTGQDGGYAVNLPSGFYDVFISSPAFSPLCRKIRIKDRVVTFDARLPADPLVVDELGTRVEARP
jgi:hypothetical protein